MSTNAELAALFEEMADHLEARDVDFKPNAYRRAADSIQEHTISVEMLYEEGGEAAIREIEDVGDALASKTAEYLESGTIEELETLRAELPVEMGALTAVEGVGPKTVKALYDALGVQTLDDLEAAAAAGEIQTVSGFGSKTESNIAENIPFARESRARSLLGEAWPVADRVVAFFERVDAVQLVDVAGSIRRWRSTIGDVDVLVASEDGDSVVTAFQEWDAVDEVIEAGPSKASVRVDDLQVDLRVVGPAEFGAALQYFTGSKEHNVAVRNYAIEMGLKVNEYGVFDVSERRMDGPTEPDDAPAVATDEGVDDSETASKARTDQRRTGERVAGETEAGVYEALGMEWMEPELRENRGEIEAAIEGTLPELVAVDDVRGDLHVHTEWSDGGFTIEAMVDAATEFGHEYVAITDHATGPGMVGGVGLSDEELLEQLETVRRVAARASIEVFAGVEANIGSDGSISVGEDVLAELDCVVASPHSGLDGDGTDRLVAAAEHPEVDVIGHPTGRMLNQRPGQDVDVERLAAVAAAHDTALEINADPRRLDLRSAHVKLAVETGATVVVDTDAHRTGSYEHVRYGVHTARRGWAEAADVLNCCGVDGVCDFLGLR